jgi:hypothetical protein
MNISPAHGAFESARRKIMDAGAPPFPHLLPAFFARHRISRTRLLFHHLLLFFFVFVFFFFFCKFGDFDHGGPANALDPLALPISRRYLPFSSTAARERILILRLSSHLLDIPPGLTNARIPPLAWERRPGCTSFDLDEHQIYLAILFAAYCFVFAFARK